MNRALSALLIVSALLAALPAAAKDTGAVLLVGESGIEAELVSDLNEVLVTALLQKSANRYSFLGKEMVLTQLSSRRTKGDQPCIKDNECIRSFAREKGVSLMVVGAIGKAAGGYRLELRKISLTGIPDRMRRNRVKGDLTALIEEVESAADWILAPENPYLKLTVNQPDATLSLDGKDMGPVKDKPIQVAPGKHVLLIRKPGFADVKTEVDCQQGKLCEAKVELKKGAIAKPDKPEPDKPEPDKPEPDKPEPPGKNMTWLTLGWVSTGLAALSLGGAVYFTLALAEDQSEFNDKTAELCGSATCKLTKQAFYAHPDIKQIKDSGESNATWATVSWIAAGVTGAAAVTCFVIHAMQKPDEPAALPALVPVLHPDMAGLVFTLDF